MKDFPLLSKTLAIKDRFELNVKTKTEIRHNKIKIINITLGIRKNDFGKFVQIDLNIDFFFLSAL